jgi:hypothetical protein
VTKERTAGKWVVKAKAELELDLGTSKRAEVLWDAVSADDPDSVRGRVEGETLHIDVGPAPAPSVRMTLDDVLACLQAASGGVDIDRGKVDPWGVE